MRGAKKNTYFTVIIPTLNEEVAIPKLLGDLKRQTFKDFSIIIVDANSKDKTREISQKLEAKVLVSKIKNVSSQRNLGAAKSVSEWVVFMDADCRIPKDFLEKVKVNIDLSKPDILSTWIKPDSNLKKDELIASVMNIFMELNKNSSQPYILESMVFVKRKSFKKLGGFNADIPWGEGRELMEKCKKEGMKFEFIKEPKYTYSFRRLKKMGPLKMLQGVTQMEIIRLINGELTPKNASYIYPMKGGGFYQKGEPVKLTLGKFFSILFQDKTINKKSIKLFQKGIDAWKSFFG